jgi:hypothetical protein
MFVYGYVSKSYERSEKELKARERVLLYGGRDLEEELKVNEGILKKDMEISKTIYRSWSFSLRRRLKHPDIPRIA